MTISTGLLTSSISNRLKSQQTARVELSGQSRQTTRNQKASDTGDFKVCMNRII